MSTANAPTQTVATTHAPFAWPETKSSDEACFTTPQKGEFVNGKPLQEHTYVDARAIACRLSASQSGNGSPDQVDVVYRVAPNQLALRKEDHTLSPVDGELVITTMSLNGGAYPITMKSLERSGFDSLKTVSYYEKDPKATSLIQQLKSAGADAAQIQQAMGMLAIQRGDLAASGLGSSLVRLVVKNDTYKEQTRIKLAFVNAIPAPAKEDDVLRLVMNLPRPGTPGATTTRAAAPSRQTSAAPAAGGPSKDNVDF